MTAALLTKREAADYLRISLRSFTRHVLATCPKIKVGHSIRIKLEDLQQWVEQHKATGSASTTAASITSGGSRRAPAKGTISRSAPEILLRVRAEQQSATERSASGS